MGTRSSVLAWRILGTVEPDGLSSMGSHRVGHDLSDLAAAAAKSGTLFSTVGEGGRLDCEPERARIDTFPPTPEPRQGGGARRSAPQSPGGGFAFNRPPVSPRQKGGAQSQAGRGQGRGLGGGTWATGAKGWGKKKKKCSWNLVVFCLVSLFSL